MSSAIPETGMQVVGDFIEDGSGDGVPVFVDKIYLDRPRSEREAFDAGIFVSGKREEGGLELMGW